MSAQGRNYQVATEEKAETGTEAINLGVIGYGYWGPNIVRNFATADNVAIKLVCDHDLSALRRVRKSHPHLEITGDYQNVVCCPDIDAVAIITPVSSHYDLAKKALLNGKHIFVEKPFTATSAQAEELIELAEKKGLKIMVDHTFTFTSAVRKIKQLIDDGTLGELYYYDSIRVNLGLFQGDVNVIWDLAPHDFSIMDYLVSQKPHAISACGKAHVNGLEDTAYITLYFTSNMIAHFNVNWLSPVKVRKTLVGGEKKMLVWDDLEVDEKIKVYDRGIDITTNESKYNLLVSYRSGDMWAPKVDQVEALKTETEYFIDCILNDKAPVNDGRAGLRIVKMLEACDKSLENHGGMVRI